MWAREGIVFAKESQLELLAPPRIIYTIIAGLGCGRVSGAGPMIDNFVIVEIIDVFARKDTVGLSFAVFANL